MKNGYTPKEFAYAMAINGIDSAFQDRAGELDGLTPGDRKLAREQLIKLREELAARVSFDLGPLVNIGE